MKITSLTKIILLGVYLLISNHAWSAERLNTDSEYDIKVAVTVNGNDNIVGKLEYSNNTLQLVTFSRIGDKIYTEPYVFEVIDKKVVNNNVHMIKCKSINDKYGYGIITGTIDFSDELKPKVHLVNESVGGTYISNITLNGNKLHSKYIPRVWLGN